MARRPMSAVLSRIAAEMKDEEARDEFEELREQVGDRRVSHQDILDAISEAPPEARAALRKALAEAEEAEEVEDEPKPKRKPKASGEEDVTDDDEEKPPASKRRVRPGRKSGGAYQFYVDDDGRVHRSATAVIYSGEDEPDEVELLPDTDDEDKKEDE